MMTGIILSGGKNLRFNQVNKAFLKIGSETIIENIIKKFKLLFNEILIVTNAIEPFKYLNYQLSNYSIRIVKDIIPDKGSLGGIYSGLVNSKSEYNFIVACDMPFINIKLVNYLLEHVDGYDIVIPRLNDRSLPNNGFETLHAVYCKSCIGHIEKQIRDGNLKIIDFFSEVKVKEITEDIIKQFDLQLLSFFNINTEDDYQKALKIMRQFIPGI